MMTTDTRTAEAIAAMLTEPTGVSILDSGDAYGRHWQRNAGTDLTFWQDRPEATLDRWGCITLDVFHYMLGRLEYVPDADEGWQEWAAANDPDDRRGWLDLAVEYAETVNAGDCYGELREVRTWNTYNGEDMLSQVLQGVTYCGGEYGDEVYALVQIHGGCDVRGGYTRPRVFRVMCDSAAYFPYDNADAEVYCSSCETGWTIRAGYEVIHQDGHSVDRFDLDANDDGVNPCPECGGQVSVAAPYVC